jgi:homoserine O-acetyltransferase
MSNVRPIPSPQTQSDDRAHEADHPSSLVAKFGMDQPLRLDCLTPIQRHGAN